MTRSIFHKFFETDTSFILFECCAWISISSITNSVDLPVLLSTGIVLKSLQVPRLFINFEVNIKTLDASSASLFKSGEVYVKIILVYYIKIFTLSKCNLTALVKSIEPVFSSFHTERTQFHFYSNTAVFIKPSIVSCITIYSFTT